jgi:deoxyribodipyrimidine photo-lyase
MKTPITICWLRRDLRIRDNAALYYALKNGGPVLLLFIFDTQILDKLSDRKDARVTFIYNAIQEIELQLKALGSSILIKTGDPIQIWQEQILKEYTVKDVFINHDYEPYARQRDAHIADILHSQAIPFHTFKDQVIFEKDELLKPDGSPYTVYSPYARQWFAKLNDFYLKSYPTEKYLHCFLQTPTLPMPGLADLGFEASTIPIPPKNYESKLAGYETRRDYPGDDATSRIGVHLRFGTVSIREAVGTASDRHANKWISELVWRDFYMMILWHFPQVVTRAFKPAYDNIRWRNDETEFKAWCEGNTGYPIVDAGMKQMNQIGYMHNRLRMVVASFLTKHLLIDWRWGEAYFAEKLLDYDQASNIGGWQWAFGSGNDAAPYFRVFNPELQAKKFDPENKYIDQWAPEYKQKKHVQPIVEHAFARDRALQAFKDALNPGQP